MGTGILAALVVVCALSVSCSRFHEVVSYKIDEGIKIVFEGDNYWDNSSPVHFVVYMDGVEVLTSGTVDYYVPGEASPEFKLYFDRFNSVIGIASMHSEDELISIIDRKHWIGYLSEYDGLSPEINRLTKLLRADHPNLKEGL